MGVRRWPWRAITAMRGARRAGAARSDPPACACILTRSSHRDRCDFRDRLLQFLASRANTPPRVCTAEIPPPTTSAGNGTWTRVELRTVPAGLRDPDRDEVGILDPVQGKTHDDARADENTERQCHHGYGSAPTPALSCALPGKAFRSRAQPPSGGRPVRAQWKFYPADPASRAVTVSASCSQKTV